MIVARLRSASAVRSNSRRGAPHVARRGRRLSMTGLRLSSRAKERSIMQSDLPRFTSILGALFALTACQSGTTPNQGVPVSLRVAAAQPPCFVGYHVEPSYAKVNRGAHSSFTLIYTEDYYRCPYHEVAADWITSGPSHGHLSCKKQCATTTFWSFTRGTYYVAPKGFRVSATVVVR